MESKNKETIYSNCFTKACENWKEDWDQNKSLGFSFLSGVLMILIGLAYHHERCDQAATLYLLFAGGLDVCFFVLKARNTKDVVLPLLIFLKVAFQVCGCIFVFGGYSSWQYTEAENDGYCPFSPFLTALVTLVTSCVIYGLLLLLGSLLLVCHLVSVAAMRLRQ